MADVVIIVSWYRLMYVMQTVFELALKSQPPWNDEKTPQTA